MSSSGETFCGKTAEEKRIVKKHKKILFITPPVKKVRCLLIKIYVFARVNVKYSFKSLLTHRANKVKIDKHTFPNFQTPALPHDLLFIPIFYKFV